MGVATLPQQMVADAIKRGDVVELCYPWRPKSLEFLARYDEERAPPHIVEVARLARYVAGRT